MINFTYIEQIGTAVSALLLCGLVCLHLNKMPRRPVWTFERWGAVGVAMASFVQAFKWIYVDYVVTHEEALLYISASIYAVALSRGRLEELAQELAAFKVSAQDLLRDAYVKPERRGRRRDDVPGEHF